jgi:NADPH2:quinone reductase
MKAIRIERYGGPEVLLRGDEPVPKPQADEVLIEVAFAGVNFMDVHTRQGKYASSRSYPVRLPVTLGMEGAGTVVEAGARVDRFKQGDRVAWCIAWGSYAEYAAVPASRVAHIPDGIAFDLAAASLFQGSTAHYLCYSVGQLAPGVTCLVHAASGSIGQLLVQMAKRAGATVFATASTHEKTAIAASLGADHVMLYEGGRFADRIREATNGIGIDVVFDAVGRATLRDSFRVARTRGLIVNYGSVSGSLSDLDPIELGEAGSLYLTRPRLTDYLQDAETVQQRADEVFAGLLDGTLHVKLDRRYTFDDVEEAHAALEERRQIGKAVLAIGRFC